MSSGRCRRGGCERIVNDAPIIGENVAMSNDYNKAIFETEAFKKKVKTLRDHRNRIKHIHEFLAEKHHDYYALGTRELTEEELQDPSKHWWKNKRDLIYKGFNVNIFKAFLSKKGTKDNGKTS